MIGNTVKLMKNGPEISRSQAQNQYDKVRNYFYFVLFGNIYSIIYVKNYLSIGHIYIYIYIYIYIIVINNYSDH